ncbi:hypothetical protein ACOYR4_15420 [Acidovorax sp. M14]|uniref:hypothetical protein n=1 Tax=Acidovorax sp. M14 TaxID=3411354 RepID=UPI003BF4764E
MRNQQANGFNGPEPISFTELKAWLDVVERIGNEVSRWELQTILAIDRAWIQQTYTEMNRFTEDQKGRDKKEV